MLQVDIEKQSWIDHVNSSVSEMVNVGRSENKTQGKIRRRKQRKTKKAVFQTKCEVERNRSSNVNRRNDRKYL